MSLAKTSSLLLIPEIFCCQLYQTPPSLSSEEELSIAQRGCHILLSEENPSIWKNHRIIDLNSDLEYLKTCLSFFKNSNIRTAAKKVKTCILEKLKDFSEEILDDDTKQEALEIFQNKTLKTREKFHAFANLKSPFEGKTLLMHAVENNQALLVKDLLSLGASVHETDSQLFTALHMAHSESIAQLLLQRGACVNAEAKDGSTPLDTIEDFSLKGSKVIQVIKDAGGKNSSTLSKIKCLVFNFFRNCCAMS